MRPDDYAWGIQIWTLVLGCAGSNRPSVSGDVTLDGQPEFAAIGVLAPQ